MTEHTDMIVARPVSTPTAAAEGAKAAEVFYDGACPICRREIALYRGMADERVDWRDVSADAETTGSIESSGLSREELLARFHVRRRNGDLVSGFPAFMAVWRASPRLAWLGRLFDRQPFHWLGDRLYALFLRVRPLWRS